MIELTQYINSQKRLCQSDISLSGWLECMIGNYFVEGEGSGDKNFHWLTVYYDIHIDPLYGEVETVSANIVAYVSSDYRWSFVCSKHSQKFQKDTEQYDMVYIPISSFYEELLQCSHIDLLPQEFSDVVWIDDDFMNDETLTFDFDSFFKMEDGIVYLNPKHFSVSSLIHMMHSV